jgi:hypothetical protein
MSERYRNALRTFARVAIRDFPDGSAAKIAGRLSCLAPPLTAPLSRRPCAYWALWGQFPDPLDRELFFASDGQDFLIDDETGVACVRIAEAAFAITRDCNVDPAELPDPSDELKRVIRRQGVSWSTVHQELLLREGVLEPGELVTVFGRGRREPDPRTPSGYRDAPPSWLVLDTPPEGTLIVSDIAKSAK